MSLKDLGHPRKWPLHIKVRGVCIIAVIATLWALKLADKPVEAPKIRYVPLHEPMYVWILPFIMLAVLVFLRKK